MKLPVDLRFVGFSHDEAVEALVHANINQLGLMEPDVADWRVLVQRDNQHESWNHPVAVRVGFSLRGQDVTLMRVGDQELDAVLMEAFDATRRKIVDMQ